MTQEPLADVIARVKWRMEHRHFGTPIARLQSQDPADFARLIAVAEAAWDERGRHSERHELPGDRQEFCDFCAAIDGTEEQSTLRQTMDDHVRESAAKFRALPKVPNDDDISDSRLFD